MAALNQAKIINALEHLIIQQHEDFIYGFLLAYGTPKSTINRLKMGDAQRNVAYVTGDVAVPQKLYFRAVVEGVSVANALEEIISLPLLEQYKIRFVLVTDFVTVAAYDRKVKDNTEFDFSELKLNYEFFLPLTGKYEKAIEHAEHPADVKACEKMGRLYDSICAINHYGKDELHTLNVFLTRLLFCFFAEDTGIFPQTNQMTLALKSLTEKDGSDLANFFERLFLALSLPNDAPERQHLSTTFQKFPYVNGGLFQEHIHVPQFNTRSRKLLLECGSMAWSDISPVIFGSMFQAVMDPAQRRSMGAHYTSEKNILKLVKPLFLDELHQELEHILSLKKGKKSALQAFQSKLGSLGFLDPACGCGNFLVVSYRELKELELQAVLALRAEEPVRTLALDVKLLSKVNINQFYGIEIEEFPVEIARVSMWLMEHVMNVKFGKFLGCVIPSIPLHHSAKIVCANALTIPWEDIVAPDKLHFILGNPPFSGARMMSTQQKHEITQVVEKESAIPLRYKNMADDLDYVSAWYFKAARFICKTSIQTSFVSTNSICQGEQAAPVWNTLLLDYGLIINFAYQTFKWGNEAKGNAAVHCVIVGFSSNGTCHFPKKIIGSSFERVVEYISPYLIGVKSTAVIPEKKPLCNVPKMKFGSQPRDGGHFVLSFEQRESILKENDQLKNIIRPYIGVDEFLYSHKRYCIWLHDVSDEATKLDKTLLNIISSVKSFRISSKAKTTNQYAKTPHLFAQIAHPYTDYLVVPRTSSENRKYIPIGFFDKNTIASDAMQIIPNATLYHFGVLTSTIHMAWMRTICGRLKSDYRYSASIIYNTFPWPNPTETQKKHIYNLSQIVLDTREMYPDMNLAQMYDPGAMPKPLQEAHLSLDAAVDGLYQSKPFADDEDRLHLLFKLYEQLVDKNKASQAVSKEESEDD